MKYYFISDAHLGSRLVENPRGHEAKLVAWLDMVKADATAIFMLGDMFDFWYEYRTVVPKGYVRFLGKMAELVDAGIEIHFFVGNHDLWTFGYLENEVGLTVHRQPKMMKLGEKNFFLAHGNGLTDKDKDWKHRMFHSRTCQRLFRFVPPQIGQNLGYEWSKRNREKLNPEETKYKGEQKEPLIIYAKELFSTNPNVDFAVFGHRHIQLDLQLQNQKRVIMLGDFVNLFSYGVFDGVDFWLENFE